MPGEWKVFIASAGHWQARRLAEAVKNKISTWDWANAQPVEVEPWYESFEPGDVVIDALEAKANDADFAVFIFHPTDRVSIRGKVFSQVRDNVVFEYGMFLSTLGRARAFVVAPAAPSKLRPPSDLEGMHVLFYDATRIAGESPDFDKAVDEACRKICLRMERLRGREPKNLLSIQGLLTRSGVSEVFPHREQALARMIADIEAAQRSVTIYARVYLSELMQDDRLADALAKAISTSQALRQRGSSFLVRQVSTPPDNGALVGAVWEIERKSKPGRWPTVANYREHVGHAWEAFRKASLVLGTRLESTRGRRRRKVRFEAAPFVRLIPPYSFLLIDEAILYVGFYLLNRETKFGRYSPAVRLERHQSTEPSSWFESFLEEARLYESQNVGEPDSWEVPVRIG